MDFVGEIEKHASSLRSAALKAGPDAEVTTCPDWTVLHLVRHVAEVHTWAAQCVVTAPEDGRPKWPKAPREFDEVLPWWDEGLTLLLARLRETPPDSPAWTFHGPQRAAFWSRRQAHETAIHRLDAEIAAGHELPPLMFDPEFAADGVDEYLTVMVHRRIELGHGVKATGRLLVHAADAGRTWQLRLTEGGPLVVTAPQDAAFDEDATLAGTADAIYRAFYARPGHAIVSGDESLLEALPRP